MNPRTTGVAFVLAAALAAFVYFYEIRGEEARLEAEQAAEQLFPEVDGDAIEAIELTSEDGRPARLERADGVWRLVEPIDFPADEFAADGMSTALAELSSEMVIDDPQPPSVYGLDADERVVRFVAGGETHTLRIGNKTPVGSNSYASVEGRDEVYAVPSYRAEALRKPLADLREKRILRFDRAAVERISAHWPGGRVVLVKDGEDWQLAEPIQSAADSTTVSDLLSDLSFLRAEGFEDEPPPDGESGLDVPAFAVELTLSPDGEGEEPLTRSLAFGAESDGTRLVRGTERSLYRVPAERMEDFPRELVAYRYRQLADFAASDAQRVELLFHSGGESVSVTATRGDAEWTSSPEPVEPAALADMVAELASLRAGDIAADQMGPDELRGAGLDPANVVISVFGAGEGPEARLAEVHLGEVQGDSGVLARVPDDPVVYRLAYDRAQHIPVSLEAFRNRFVVAPEEAPEAEEAPESPLVEIPEPEPPATP